MKIIQLGLIVLGVALAGCATSNLPPGARLVGGGLMIDYQAPSDGIAILMERTSGRIVATKSLEEGRDFDFAPTYQGCSEVLFSMFAPTNAVNTGTFPQVPTSACFQLYFIPAKAKKE